MSMRHTEAIPKQIAKKHTFRSLSYVSLGYVGCGSNLRDTMNSE